MKSWLVNRHGTAHNFKPLFITGVCFLTYLYKKHGRKRNQILFYPTKPKSIPWIDQRKEKNWQKNCQNIYLFLLTGVKKFASYFTCIRKYSTLYPEDKQFGWPRLPLVMDTFWLPGLPILFKKDLTLGSVTYSDIVQFSFMIILKAINVMLFLLFRAVPGVPLSLSFVLL